MRREEMYRLATVNRHTDSASLSTLVTGEKRDAEIKLFLIKHPTVLCEAILYSLDLSDNLL